MSVNALRLYHPLARDEWLAQAAPGAPFLPADAEDVGRAMLAALEYRNGFQAFHVSGDYEHKVINMDKARRLLGWEPLARPRERAGDAPAAAHSARE
jgi:nucleoside-diphosphate-sugar epimerase